MYGAIGSQCVCSCAFVRICATSVCPFSAAIMSAMHLSTSVRLMSAVAEMSICNNSRVASCSTRPQRCLVIFAGVVDISSRSNEHLDDFRVASIGRTHQRCHIEFACAVDISSSGNELTLTGTPSQRGTAQVVCEVGISSSRNKHLRNYRLRT
eukprot:GEMP01016767.1.p1 GENE.GEMP01016767.1~~GEMP01016767.1.p1  ORF type:complete len:153 (+),score=26.28 GEMP01016767.1:1928-2386(+)